MKNRKFHKRHFQLLEVMIALFLVAVCALPVIRSYVNIYNDQKKLSQNLTLDHLAYLAHARIIEDLYFKGAKEEPLKGLLAKDMSLKDMEPAFLKDSPYDFVYHLTIERPVMVKTQEKAERLLLNLTLHAVRKDDPNRDRLRTYDYKTCIVKASQMETQDSPDQKDQKKDKEQKNNEAS